MQNDNKKDHVVNNERSQFIFLVYQLIICQDQYSTLIINLLLLLYLACVGELIQVKKMSVGWLKLAILILH